LGDIDKPADETPTNTPAVADSRTEPVISVAKLLTIKKIADNLQDSCRQLVELLAPLGGQPSEEKIRVKQAAEIRGEVVEESVEGKIVEGIFDGEKMIDGTGKIYPVPVNYASKSRLVEGDSLKLTITPQGTFIFKQIKPVERRRLVGILEETDTGEFYVLADDRRWRVLNASVTYFKGEAGDEAVILTSREGLTRWAAVENIIKR